MQVEQIHYLTTRSRSTFDVCRIKGEHRQFQTSGMRSTFDTCRMNDEQGSVTSDRRAFDVHQMTNVCRTTFGNRWTIDEIRVERLPELREGQTYESQRPGEKMVKERRRNVERHDVRRPGGGSRQTLTAALLLVSKSSSSLLKLTTCTLCTKNKARRRKKYDRGMGLMTSSLSAANSYPVPSRSSTSKMTHSVSVVVLSSRQWHTSNHTTSAQFLTRKFGNLCNVC